MLTLYNIVFKTFMVLVFVPAVAVAENTKHATFYEAASGTFNNIIMYTDNIGLYFPDPILNVWYYLISIFAFILPDSASMILWIGDIIWADFGLYIFIFFCLMYNAPFYYHIKERKLNP